MDLIFDNRGIEFISEVIYRIASTFSFSSRTKDFTSSLAQESEQTIVNRVFYLLGYAD